MNEFKDIKNNYNSVEIPPEIDIVIESAIKRGKKHKGLKVFKPIAIAAACIIIFIASINLSPAFASVLGSIPGLSYFVKLVSFDKGLPLAVENGFIMKINKSVVDKDIKFSINNAILDRRRLIIDYTIETTGEYDDLELSNIYIQDEHEHDIDIFISYGECYDEKFKENKKKIGTINVNFPDDTKPIPKNIILICKGFNSGCHENLKNPIPGNWKISFELNQQLVDAKPIVYQLNKSTTIGFMKFYVESVKVYPTVTDVKIRMDENNKYKYAGFKNMRIEDEKGNKYNFKSGILPSDIEHIYGFESSFFVKPDELYFKADGIYCIPKEDQFLVIDIDNRKIIDDCGYNLEYINLIQNTDLNGEKYDFLLSFKVEDEEILKECKNASHYGISFEKIVLDENNNEYSIDSSSTSWGNNYLGKNIGIKNMKNMPHILKFKISGAARGVYAPISVKLK